MLKYRSEIDSLRAISIFLVVFFHFEIFNIRGGFIGVDVFFVISGYLITKIIIQDIQTKNFSIIDFYNRRARRILPALYLIILLTLLLGFFLFGLKHFERLQTSSLTSVLGLSNFYFASEYNYFDYNKIFKPLLHTWSLSVELQFYLIWPFLIWLLFFLFKQKTKYLILILLVTSFLVSTVYSPRSEAFFYFTPFRFYEFCLGSLLIFFTHEFKKKTNDILFFLGIALIFLSSLILSEKSIFPGSNALIPCIGAVLILISSSNLDFFKTIFINKYLTFFGKISYSFYLTHWPILIFIQYYYINPLSLIEKIFLIFLVILFSFFSYKYVELPFRRRTKKNYYISNSNFLFSIFFTILIVVMSFNFISSNYKFQNIDFKKKNILNNLNQEKEYRTTIEAHAKNKFYNRDYLKDRKPKILIFGDSHGLDLYISLIKNIDFSNLDFTYYEFTSFSCFKKKKLNDQIVKVIKKNLFSITNFCENTLDDVFGHEIFDLADKIIITSRWKEKIDFGELLKMNKNFTKEKLIIFGRKPYFYDIPTLFLNVEKNINKHAFLQKDEKISIINEHIKNESNKNDLIFFDIENLMCKEKKCTVFFDNKLLISDSDHWSKSGSNYYGKELSLNNFLNVINNTN